MKTEKSVLFATLILLALVAGCDPSPYDLTLHVTDVEGHAIPRAVVILSGLEDLQLADDTGTVTQTDIEDETVTIIVAAQGYVSQSIEAKLERGRNDLVVALEQAIPAFDPTNP
jgi:hypothetical protein